MSIFAAENLIIRATEEYLSSLAIPGTTIDCTRTDYFGEDHTTFRLDISDAKERTAYLEWHYGRGLLADDFDPNDRLLTFTGYRSGYKLIHERVDPADPAMFETVVALWRRLKNAY